MTALAASYSEAFKAIAIDAVVIRDGHPAPGDKIRKLSGGSYATVVGSESVLDSISQLSGWAEYKNVPFTLRTDYDLEVLSTSSSKSFEIYKAKKWNVPVQDTTVVLLSRADISVLNFEMSGDGRLTLIDKFQLKCGQLYSNFGGTPMIQEISVNDQTTAKDELTARIKQDEVIAKRLNRGLPYVIGDKFSFMLLPEKESEPLIEESPFIRYSEYLCAALGQPASCPLLNDPKFEWSPF